MASNYLGIFIQAINRIGQSPDFTFQSYCFAGMVKKNFMFGLDPGNKTRIIMYLDFGNYNIRLFIKTIYWQSRNVVKNLIM